MAYRSSAVARTGKDGELSLKDSLGVKLSLRWVCESPVEEDLGLQDELKEKQMKNSEMERGCENIHPWQRTERKLLCKC